MKQIIAQDVQGWYAQLNAILAGHGLDSIAVPEITGTARAAQVTPLTDKLEDMKSDTYYKFASYSDWGAAVKGAVMRELTPSGLEATLSSIEASIVCRNMATNSYGTCSNGSNSNGYKSYGSNSYGSYSDGTNSNGTCSKGTKSNGSNSNGRYGNGTNSNGANNNGSEPDTGNTNGSNTN